MPVTWIEHNGNQILYMDFTDVDREEMLKVLHETVEVLKSNTSSTPLIANYTNTHISSKFMSEVQKFGREQDDKLGKLAVVGIGGFRKVFAQGYNKFTGQNVLVADTLEEAKEFVTKP